MSMNDISRTTSGLVTVLVRSYRSHDGINSRLSTPNCEKEEKRHKSVRTNHPEGRPPSIIKIREYVSQTTLERYNSGSKDRWS